MEPPPPRSLQVLAPLALALAFVVLALVLFGAGGNDDTHITYWPAWTLAHHGAILSYNGVALEQSSSLSLVLLLAILHLVTGIALPTLGWAVSLLAGVAAVVLLARRRLAAGLIAAGALPLVHWSTSGMESSLAALLLLGSIAAADRFLRAPGTRTRLLLAASLAATAATRPELPFVLICMAAAWATWAVWRPADRRVALELLGWTVAVAGALALFRLALFGAPMPHPATMKAGGFDWARGLAYAKEAAGHLGWLLPALALVGLILLAIDLLRRRFGHPAPILLAGVAVACLGFVILSGGDWMPAARFVVPAVPLLALLAADAIGTLPWRTLQAGLAVLVAGSCLWATFGFARSDRNTGRPHLELARTRAGLEAIWGPLPFVDAELANRAHLRDAGFIPAVLATVEALDPTREQPVYLMSGQAGMVPFHVLQRHFGKVRFYDLFGLTDDALVECLPPNRIRRSALGAGPNAFWLWSHLEEMDRCGLERPHVIYNVSVRRQIREAMRTAGYSIVYEQRGPLRIDHPLAPGGGRADALIAVRNDLIDRISLPVARVDFPLEPAGRR